MQEILGHRIDKNGFYIEEVFVNPYNVPSDVILGNWDSAIAKPKFENGQWNEGLVPGERTPISEEFIPPRDIDELKKQQADLTFQLMLAGVI